MRRRGAATGSAAVEFAFVLPILLLLIAGIVDFGRAMYTQSILTNAAREGARAGVMGVAPADVQLRATRAASGIPLLVVLSPGAGCGPSGGPLKVTATSDFTWILVGPALRAVGASSALPPRLSASASMECGG